MSLTDEDLAAARKAMERAAEMEGISYQSVAEFVRDALRRRLEVIDEAFRQAHGARDRLGLPDPKRKKEG